MSETRVAKMNVDSEGMKLFFGFLNVILTMLSLRVTSYFSGNLTYVLKVILVTQLSHLYLRCHLLIFLQLFTSVFFFFVWPIIKHKKKLKR